MFCGIASRLLTAVVAGVSLVGCGQSERVRSRASGLSSVRVAAWTARRHVNGGVDLSGPTRSGSIYVAAAGRLKLLMADGTVRAFARGYSAPGGLEPYIALSPGQAVQAARCRFPRDEIYALRLTRKAGVTAVTAQGHVHRFARLPRRGLENGIAFDETGRFGHRLLVTATSKGHTTVFAIDCRGHVEVLTSSAPRMEGGVVVAPSTFGRFGGDLIAPDERSGNIYAISPEGRTSLLSASGIAHGPDIGVESEGFVPARFTGVLVADRLTPGNPHPGDDVILGIRSSVLAKAGVRAGDLLAVSEGGARTVAVTCGQVCRVRQVAAGPREAHIEGHIVFSGTAAASQ